MAVLSVRLFGDPVLREKGKAVGSFDGDLRKLVYDLVETMEAANGVGLAAPQVGVQLRMFVYDIGEGLQVVCNPEIVEARGAWAFEEGCLSIPGIHVDFERPEEVVLRGQDVDGSPLEIHARDLLARALQHETDHCDGILFVDRISKADRRLVMRHLRETLPPGRTSFIPHRHTGERDAARL